MLAEIEAVDRDHCHAGIEPVAKHPPYALKRRPQATNGDRARLPPTTAASNNATVRIVPRPFSTFAGDSARQPLLP